jgi:hypothetical protein
MDTQKFNFLSCSSSLNEVTLAASDLLTDIKNVLGVIQYNGNMIGCNISQISDPSGVIVLNECVQSIKSLTQEYDLLCQQRKLLTERIKYLKSIRQVAA